MFDRERMWKWQTEESRRDRNARLIELGLVATMCLAVLVMTLVLSKL